MIKSLIYNSSSILLFVCVCSGVLLLNVTSVFANVELSSFVSLSAGQENFDIDINQIEGGNYMDSVADIGDIDGDGVGDLALGAPVDDDGGIQRGAVWILFMNNDGTIKAYQKISQLEGNLNFELLNGGEFGREVKGIGDLNGDGVNDMAVSSVVEGSLRGVVWIVFLKTDGTALMVSKIANNVGGLGNVLDANDQFGTSLGFVDIDNDGAGELLVGAVKDDDGSVSTVTRDKGAVWVLKLTPNGQVFQGLKISSLTDGFTGRLDPRENFGRSIVPIGDLDNDGINDLAVGSDYSNVDGSIWILFMNEDFTVKNANRIANNQSGLDNIIETTDRFGSSLAFLNDLNQDGLDEILVGAPSHGAPDSTLGQGAAWLLSLNSSGQVERTLKIDLTDFGIPYSEEAADWFGYSMSTLSDSSFDVIVGTQNTFIDESVGYGKFWLLNFEHLVENSAPILTPITPQTTTEGTELTFTLSATDEDNDLITYSATNLPSGATLDETTGVFSWIPDFNDEGEYEVTFTATEDTPEALSDSETVTIGVINFNRAPELAPIGNQTVNEGDILEFTVSATDEDNDSVTITATNLPNGATFNGTAFSWNTTYTDAGNYENIEFTATDNGTPMELDVEIITITVGDVNRMPELTNPGPQEVLEEETVSFNIQANDPDNDTVTIEATNLPSGAAFNGSNFTWTPDLSDEGVYTVTFTATDNGTPIESASTDVVITVGDNPTPVEQAQDLIEIVVTLDLPQNIENSYMANLQKVGQFIAEGKITPALNQLNAFKNKVQQDYQQGRLTQAEYQQLIDAANNLIADLNN